jgi:hypothetical protein
MTSLQQQHDVLTSVAMAVQHTQQELAAHKQAAAQPAQVGHLPPQLQELLQVSQHPSLPGLPACVPPPPSPGV